MQEQWHADGLIERLLFIKGFMRAKQVAVVGSKNYNRVAGQTVLSQRLQEFANAIIQRRAIGVIPRLSRSRLSADSFWNIGTEFKLVRLIFCPVFFWRGLVRIMGRSP